MLLLQILGLNIIWTRCSIVAFVAGAEGDDAHIEAGNLFALANIGGLYGEEQEVSVCRG